MTKKMKIILTILLSTILFLVSIVVLVAIFHKEETPAFNKAKLDDFISMYNFNGNTICYFDNGQRFSIGGGYVDNDPRINSKSKYSLDGYKYGEIMTEEDWWSKVQNKYKVDKVYAEKVFTSLQNNNLECITMGIDSKDTENVILTKGGNGYLYKTKDFTDNLLNPDNFYLKHIEDSWYEFADLR